MTIDNHTIRKDNNLEKGSKHSELQPPFDELLFKQELNEVYLLLDYISGQPDKHLAGLDGKISDPNDEHKKLTSSEIISRISLLRYPSDSSRENRSKEAALLLMLKDELNALAFPARGLTVAYTTMFTETGTSSEASRFRAAQLAYPSLEKSATSFRLIKNILSWAGLFITIISATLLWQAAYGVQLAARFDEAKRLDNESAVKVYDQLDREKDRYKDTPRSLSMVCDVSSNTVIPENLRTSGLHQSCNEYAYRHALLCTTIADIGRYSTSRLFRVFTVLLPIHDIKSPGECRRGEGTIGEGKQEDAQSIVGVLTMMSNYILPISFGLIGSMTALVRGIQDKISANVLSPRDKSLSLIRLPLGMVAGVCVGLFLSPSGATAFLNGSSGAFTISAAGIAFLAGYGADAFFRAIDELIGRIFDFDLKK